MGQQFMLSLLYVSQESGYSKLWFSFGFRCRRRHKFTPNAAWPTIYIISGASQDIAARSGFHLAAERPTIYVISGVSQDIERSGFQLTAPGERSRKYVL